MIYVTSRTETLGYVKNVDPVRVDFVMSRDAVSTVEISHTTIIIIIRNNKIIFSRVLIPGFYYFLVQ